ncbi:MAG: 4Fe-4S dicluster domain-containing protein [Phycisphaerales bacterium]
MGAGLALAGATTIPGCRRPDHKILPYSRTVPEGIIPGKSLYYATSMPLPGGGAEGLLVETHEGRPTKVEGNPLHPVNKGKSSLWSQATVLDLYDPDRLNEPRYREGAALRAATWDDWFKWSGSHFSKLRSDKGEGLGIIIDRTESPTMLAMLAELKAAMPKATIVQYDALENASALDGTQTAFGAPAREWLMFSDTAADGTVSVKAKVIVALDRDFLSGEPGSLAYARDFANTRRPLGRKTGKGEEIKDEMSRLYCVEAAFSMTGGMADHRLAMAPTQIPGFVLGLAKLLSARLPEPLKAAVANAPALTGEALAYAQCIAEDLLADEARGSSLIVCGASQPPAVHALVAALNDALKNIGKTVVYFSQAPAKSSAVQMADLCGRIERGEITTLVTVEANPLFSAPAELNFAALFAKVTHRITLSTDLTETSEASTWSLNVTHPLEYWGDTQTINGVISPIQPMIAPLFELSRSSLEVLGRLAGRERADGYELVREHWKKVIGGADFESVWRAALWNGVLARPARTPSDVKLAPDRVAAALAAWSAPKVPAVGALDVQWVVGINHDGRFANNGWLQETNDPASHVVWDNPAYVSPETAKALGLEQSPETDKIISGQMADLSVNGKTMRVCVWALPGLADNTVVLQTGQGRTAVGLVGQGVGFNVFDVRTSAAPWAASGATLAAAKDGDRWYPISSTQTHGSMEGRAIVREVDLVAWNTHGGEAPSMKRDGYGRDQRMSLAEQLEGGELNHMPANRGSYVNPYNLSTNDADPKARDAKGKPAKYTISPQWGMTIDLSTCTGCNVCTVACQAENNIPIVGKVGVREYREMSWIRVDRYFTGSKPGVASGMVFQPVPCVHCENAPCEVVCPVNATVHGDEGHNYMTYNRCIGTRYCANNCPYKVRRFNWFDYGVTKYQGGYVGQEAIESVYPGDKGRKPHKFDPNLIPPRLRDKLDEVSKLQKNPNVTVRSRGVMEKCSYCIQRTNEAKIDYKLKNPGKRPEDGIPDNTVQTACQQACPTDAIVFGDILHVPGRDGPKDPGSRAHAMREHNRTYMLLGYLNTRPRTLHMARVSNLNRKLLTALGETERVKWLDNPFDHHSEHGSHSHGGHNGHDSHDHEHKDDKDHKKGAFVDPARRGENGYVMSLAVLGGAL